MIIQRFPSKAGFKTAVVALACGMGIPAFATVFLTVQWEWAIRPLKVAAVVLVLVAVICAAARPRGGGRDGR